MNVAIRRATKEDAPAFQRIWNQRAGTHPVLNAWDEERALKKATLPERVSIVAEVDGVMRGFVVCFWPQTVENGAVDHEIEDEDERDIIFYTLISATAAACLKAGFNEVVRGVIAEGLPILDHFHGDLALKAAEDEPRGEIAAEVFLVPLRTFLLQPHAVLTKKYKKHSLWKAAKPVLSAFCHKQGQELA